MRGARLRQWPRTDDIAEAVGLSGALNQRQLPSDALELPAQRIHLGVDRREAERGAVLDRHELGAQRLCDVGCSADGDGREVVQERGLRRRLGGGGGGSGEEEEARRTTR